MTATPTHWHAYVYTGKGYSDSEIRKGLAPSHYPPIEIKNRKGPGQRLESLDAAMEWLEGELTTYEPLDAESFPVKERLEYSRGRLQQTAAPEVIYGYWSRSGQYVSRQLFPCTHCGG